MNDLRNVRSADIPAMIQDAVVTYAGKNYKLSPVTYDDSLDYKLLLSVIERGPTHDMSDYILEPI